MTFAGRQIMHRMKNQYCTQQHSAATVSEMILNRQVSDAFFCNDKSHKSFQCKQVASRKYQVDVLKGESLNPTKKGIQLVTAKAEVDVSTASESTINRSAARRR